MTKLTLFLFSSLLLTGAAQGADYFPLHPGDSWTYQSALNERFTISVGLAPLATVDGKVYYRLTGYASKPQWVRKGDDGVVYWLNEEYSREEILIDFRPLTGAYYFTPISEPCDQGGQAQEAAVPYKGSVQEFPATRQIRYLPGGCADFGVMEELFAENIGLVQRVNQSIIGPRPFKLVSAKVGAITYDERPGVQFRVSLPASTIVRSDPFAPVQTEVALSLRVDGLDPVLLRFPTSQRYNIAIKDEAGNTVYLWSALALFLQVIGEEAYAAKEYTVPIAPVLPDGRYRVEAWLTTDGPDRLFAAAASLTVQTR
jgi:hypothetical protein